MKVIFMGTPDFSVGTFEALIEAGHEIVLAVTQPDKPKGRGEKVQYPPVKEAALKHQIPVFQPKRVRAPECIEELRKYDADIMVVIAFGQILPKEILEMTPYGCVNVHASLLPKYRGAAPIQWAVINGEKVSGVTTMQMDEGLDTGDMLMKTEIVLDEKETGGSLHDKLARAGAGLCVQTLEALKDGTVVREPQGESTTEYARMLDKGMGRIDWSKDAKSIECLIRGLNPWPSAYTEWNGRTMKIWEADVADIDEGREPGTVIRVERDGFCVQTGRGSLKVRSLQIPGKKRMDAGAFLRGYQVDAGTVLS
ncbi:methionyl-tRNA formyltransferase [Sporofaciens sp. JLR.KK001]|uniref:methionyl-tRNA formyltransferase n=1 Tax=Sporofaciens sp. JLR.KK001 TaxID=3112621 RepID=UPI002FF255B1